MHEILVWLQGLFKSSPEIALFLSLAAGYWIGKFKFGSFQLGGVAGSLAAAVVIGQVGVEIAPVLKNVLFALFIYAVGYECGPQFFRSLNRKSFREIVLAACLALTGLATVVVMAKTTGLNKGLAAGIAAGGLTQSAIIGTAEAAIEKLDLPRDSADVPAAESPAVHPGVGSAVLKTVGLKNAATGEKHPEVRSIKDLESDVAIGYAVTYIFGSFGAIIICCNILPGFMRRGLREDALAAEMKQEAGIVALEPGQELAVQRITGRVYRLVDGFKATVGELEARGGEIPITVERVRRGKSPLVLAPDLELRGGDFVLVVGRGESVLKAMADAGREVQGVSDMELKMLHREVVLTNDQCVGKTVADLRSMTTNAARHGVYALGLVREGARKELAADTVLAKGDIIVLYGSERDIVRVTPAIGYPLPTDNKTDFVYMGLGLVVGLLVGLVSLKIGSLALTLGSGGGALLAGLVFGWFRARHPRIGAFPIGAVQLLKDMGLAGFVAVIGLTTGKQAIDTIVAHGLSLFLIGLVVTVVPMLVCMVIGKYVLRYDNTAVLAGALAGSRSANPAFGQVLAVAGNAVPTVPFAITYALANVFLTLLGPVIVALV